MHKVDACSVNIGVSLTLDMLTMWTSLVADIYHNHIQHDLKLKLITIVIYLVFDFVGEKKYIHIHTYIYLVCEGVLFR